MDLIGSANLQQAIRDIQTYPEYQNVLRVLLKHEISTLLQRLSETGEESIVMIANVSDGALSVIGSNFGERFVLEPGNETNIVTGFKEKFAEYCYKSRASAPKRRKRYDHNHRSKMRSPSYMAESQVVTKEAVEPIIEHQQETISVCSPMINGNSFDETDKAIDETVSQLVKNIFKESEERERELGEGESGTRRRRRRRRILSDHMKRESQYRYDPCYRRKETKIAQFFPTISQKCIEFRSSQNNDNNDKQQDMYLTDIKIKLEPDTDNTISDTNHTSGNENQAIHNVEERPISNGVCEIVSNSVDKSIQKIIEMETRNPSDNDSYELEPKSDGTCAVQGQPANGDGANMKIKQETSTENETENEKEIIHELINQNFNETSDTENTTNSYRTLFDKNNSDYGGSIQVDSIKIKEEPADQMYRSFEESSAEDYPDDGSSFKRKQKRSFIHNGFSYIRDKAGKGDTVYWKCGKIGCKGRVIQRGGEKIRTQDHNHNPFMDTEGEKTDTTISTNTSYQ